MAKGSEYERELCKALSTWWTLGASDAVFWRTANSGGRATARRKAGKTTRGQSADVHATDPVGEPLMNLVAIEAKRGYSEAHLGDLLDLNPAVKLAPRPLAAFFAQAARQASDEGVPFWLLVVRRDKRISLAYMAPGLATALDDAGATVGAAVGAARATGPAGASTHVVPLSEFLARVHPDHVRSALRETRG